MNQPLFLNALAPIPDRGYEQIFFIPIPNADAYQLVNAGVHFSLHRLASSNCAWSGVDGAMCYYIGAGNLWVQVFVLRLTTHAAKLCVYPMIPADPIQGMLWRASADTMIPDVARVFNYCKQQIQVLCGEAARAENYDPPCPKSASWEDRLDWLDTYHFDKSAESQAKLLRVTKGTLQNRRSDLNRQKAHRIHGKNDEFS